MAADEAEEDGPCQTHFQLHEFVRFLRSWWFKVVKIGIGTIT